VLNELADRLQSCCPGELVQLCELGRFPVGREAGHGKGTFRLGAGSGIWLAVRHHAIMQGSRAQPVNGQIMQSTERII
jgi:hypothetical protein